MKKPKDELVSSVDEFAKELMGLARNADTALQVRLDVFRDLARWVSIKHKINDSEDGTDELDEFRNRIKNPQTGKAAQGKHLRGDNRGGYRNRRKTTPEYGGSALAAIRRSLPRPNSGDDADHGHDT